MSDLRARPGRLPLRGTLSVILMIPLVFASAHAEIVLGDDAVTINGTTWKLNNGPVPLGLVEDPSLGRNLPLTGPGLNFGLSERAALSLSIERERAASDSARKLLLDFRYHW